KLGMAADVIATHPSALQLRYLQTLVEISAEKASTTIFPVPIDLLSPILKLAQTGGDEKLPPPRMPIGVTRERGSRPAAARSAPARRVAAAGGGPRPAHAARTRRALHRRRAAEHRRGLLPTALAGVRGRSGPDRLPGARDRRRPGKDAEPGDRVGRDA